MPRERSESSPKALVCEVNWAILPGNTRTKKTPPPIPPAPAPGQEQQARSERDLHHPRCDHHKVGVQRQPSRNLRVELGAGEAQVSESGKSQEAAKHQARDGSWQRRHRSSTALVPGLETRGHRPEDALVAHRRQPHQQCVSLGVRSHHDSGLLLAYRLQDDPRRPSRAGDRHLVEDPDAGFLIQVLRRDRRCAQSPS